jgi:hypothetical protein
MTLHAATIKSAKIGDTTGVRISHNRESMTLVSFYRCKRLLDGAQSKPEVIPLSPISQNSIVVLSVLTCKGSLMGQVPPHTHLRVFVMLIWSVNWTCLGHYRHAGS